MKYKIITIVLISLFLSAGLAMACEKTATDSALPEFETCDQDCVVEATESASVEPTVTPTAPPSPHGDNLSDGRASCPECTKAPVVPQGAPMTGGGR